MISKLPFVFIVVLSVALGIAFAIHILVLDNLNFQWRENLIIPSYLINFFLAATIFLGIYFLRNRLSNAIGFLFMAGSLLKFLVFFLVFYPVYKSDGVTDKLEISSFLIPYLIALVLETFYASKLLNSIEKTD